MFDPITVPFDVVMLFSVVKLKEDVDMDEIELALGKGRKVADNREEIRRKIDLREARNAMLKSGGGRG